MKKSRLFQSAISDRSGQSHLLRYTLMYIILSCLWIGFSDRALLWLVTDPKLMANVATIKGWFYVLASAALWHSMMTHNTNRISFAQSAYRALFNASPIPITINSPLDGTFVEANDSFLSLCGYGREEVIGHSPNEYGMYADPERREELFRTLLEKGRVSGADCRFRTKGGELVDLLMWLERFSLDEEDHVLAMALDRTTQKRSEKIVKESEERFATVFRASPVGMSLTRLSDGLFLDVNRAFLSLFGYQLEEVLGGTPMSLRMWVCPEHRSKMIAALNQYGRSESLETQFRTKEGSVKEVKVTAELVDIAGEKYILGLTEDITEKKASEAELQRDISERKRAEELLRFSEASLAEATRIAGLGSWEWDRTTNTLVWSKELSRILGQEPKPSFPGLQALSRSPDDTVERERAAIERALSAGTPYELELEIVRDDGTRRWVSARGEPKFDHQGAITGLRGTVLDITVRKNLEIQLLQAQRLETVGTLSAGVAHDFNNILNIIGGNLQLISETPHDAGKNRERMEAITKVTERGAQLVRQLQIFAGRSEHVLQMVDLNSVVEENAMILGETFPKKISVSLDLDKTLPLISADKNQLHQVLLNLSVNARDAMPDGGALNFTTSLAQGEALREKFPAALPLPYITVRVKDTGRGMDQEVIRRIFDPFFTTKEVGRGTGLGLSVALGIVQAHGGFIDVESEEKKGSIFQIYLPVTEGGSAMIGETLSQEPQSNRGRETILFVDDEEFGRELAVDQFSDYGYTVITAGDGSEAVEQYRRHASEISIVLSDYGLPIFDGEEVFRRLRQINPRVQFILLTGMIDDATVASLLQSGVREIVLKPYKVSDILMKLRHILDNPGDE
ncbi:MAG TPA: PAS domain S-box protein [Bacteroidota bacterium]|nr:PAS domain S-box protein [Bacteroidota bacterium]